MRIADSLRVWLAKSVPLNTTAKASKRATAQRRLADAVLCAVEPLEIRTLLSSWTVSNVSSAGSGSFPYEVQQADSAGGNQTIVFAASLTAQSSANINLHGINLTIHPASGVLTIQGSSGSYAVILNFNHSGGITTQGQMVMDYLTVENGSDSGIINTGVLTLNNCTITGNVSSTTGGGIFNNYGTLTINDSTISGNTCGTQFWAGGGGISNYSGTVNINSNSVISGNTADGSGGGIFNGDVSDNGPGTSSQAAHLTVNDSTITGNTASEFGAGVFNNGYIQVINQSAITSNHATESGGGIATSGHLTLTASTVSGNIADIGGGIYIDTTAMSNRPSANVANAVPLVAVPLGNTITNSTVSGNTGVDRAGGVYSNENLFVSGSTICNNYGDSGGGIVNVQGGQLTISNSTLTGNTTGGAGGAIYDYGSLSVTDCTITGNSALCDGGGIANYGQVVASLSETIVAGDSGGDLGGELGNLSEGFSGTYNLIGDGSGGLATSSSSHNILGTISSPINPLLGSLGNYGGPTQTMPLLPRSLALGAGVKFTGAAASAALVGQPRQIQTLARFKLRPVPYRSTPRKMIRLARDSCLYVMQ